MKMIPIRPNGRPQVRVRKTSRRYTSFLQWNLCHEAQHDNILEYCPSSGSGLTPCVQRSIERILGWIGQNIHRPFFVCLQEVWLDDRHSFLRAIQRDAPGRLGIVWTTVRNLHMPIMYNKTFHAPRLILPSQWFTMDGYGTTVYKSKNPRGSGSLRRGRPYTAFLFSRILVQHQGLGCHKCACTPQNNKECDHQRHGSWCTG